MNLPEENFQRVLALLGKLCFYPTAQLDETAAQVAELLPGEIDGCFARFREAMTGLSPDAREELYTANFEVTPSCVLYVSIHLFGEENFKRGQLLAALNARYAETRFRAGDELPDHLGHLLQFAATVAESERAELVQFCLLGPLAGMVEGLNESNAYRPLLETILLTLRAAYPGMTAPLATGSGERAAAAGCTGCGSMRDTAGALSRMETEI